MKPLFRSWISAGFLSLASTAGCASREVAPDKVAAPKADIAAAEEAGAKENPNASLQLKLANEQYDRAKHLMKEGETESAERLLVRASSDAQLALELARLDTTKQQASDALKKIEELKKQHQQLKAD